MTDSVKLVTVRNTRKQALTLMLEPWGEEFDLGPDEKLEVRASAHDRNLVVESGEEFVKVWVNRPVSVWHEGEQISGALPAPPGGDTRPEWLTGIDEVGEFLRGLGELPLRDPGGLMVRGEIGGRPGMVLLRQDEQATMLRVSSPLAMHAPAERGEALAVAIARINAQLQIMGFRLFQNAEQQWNVTFVTHVQVEPDGRLSPVAVERALAYVRRMVATFTGEIEAAGVG